MTTPWRIEFQKDILVVVEDNIFVVVRNDDSNGTLLLLWNRLRFDTRFNLAIDKGLDEIADVLLRKLLGLVEWEFLILDSLLNGEGRPLANFEVEVAGVGTKSFGVNGCEVDCTFVLLGKGLEGGGEFCTLFRSFGEDVGKGNAGLGVTD